jgi:hypothetical protein
MMLNLGKIPLRYQNSHLNEKTKLLIDKTAFNRVFLQGLHKDSCEGIRAIVSNYTKGRNTIAHLDILDSDYVSWWLKHNLRMKNYNV